MKARAPQRKKELQRAKEVMAVLDKCKGLASEAECPPELIPVYAAEWHYDAEAATIIWTGGEWRPSIWKAKGSGKH